jgi:hypothetical protein
MRTADTPIRMVGIVEWTEHADRPPLETAPHDGGPALRCELLDGAQVPPSQFCNLHQVQPPEQRAVVKFYLNKSN